ncbi:MAG: DUF1236 domain-containing protein [Proteobacteria bacterium]|nr:DUF1236 domain-containing protein [Pseudomonadota bacterium]
MHAGQHGPAASPAAKPETTGQAPSNLKPGANEGGKADSPAVGHKSDTPMKGDASQRGSGASPKAEMKGSTDAHANDAKSNSNTAGKTSTTGQGAAGAHANLTTEQRTKITSVIKQHKVEPVKLNVEVRVGTRIPQTVHYYPLPVEVVTIYPQWRGFDYIIVGDTIVVIDPGTREIVAVLDA